MNTKELFKSKLTEVADLIGCGEQELEEIARKVALRHNMTAYDFLDEVTKQMHAFLARRESV